MALSISIVTPSFNQGTYIGRTLASILEQSAAADEVVVFDGGSTDETVDVLKAFGERIKWVSRRDDGQAAAVNKGIEATHGDIIGWLNSDDIYYPDALKKVREFFESHPDVDVVYGDAKLIDERDAIIGVYPTEAWSPERMSACCIISQPATFFRRRVVREIGLLDARLHYCMDYEFWLRLADRGARFEYMPQTLAATRMHKDTKSCAARMSCLKEINEMLDAKLGYVPDAWVIAFALAVVEGKGITRRRPLRFAFALASQLASESVRWNSRLRWGLLKAAMGRVGHHIRQSLRTSGSRMRTPLVPVESTTPSR